MTYKEPVKPKRPFRRGDAVQVMNRDHTVCGGPYMVKSVTKKVATIEDGRKYQQANGYWIGENGAWPFPWLRHAV